MGHSSHHVSDATSTPGVSADPESKRLEYHPDPHNNLPGANRIGKPGPLKEKTTLTAARQYYHHVVISWLVAASLSSLADL